MRHHLYLWFVLIKFVVLIFIIWALAVVLFHISDILDRTHYYKLGDRIGVWVEKRLVPYMDRVEKEFDTAFPKKEV